MWRAAQHGITAMCPHCGEWRLIEKITNGWLCVVCSKTWK